MYFLLKPDFIRLAGDGPDFIDEATSALDNESERVVQESLERLAKERTTFVIAHRLSTITDADRIFVIENGRVAGEGTHRELLETSSLYQEMWKAHIGAKDGDAA